MVASSIDFRPGAKPRPVIVPEIGVLRPGRQDQIVIGLGCPKPGLYPARSRVDADHLVEQYRGVLLMAQDDPDGGGDIGW